MIEVEVDSIRVSLMNQQRVVLLKDTTAERYIPIWIGQFEAEAITIELQQGEQSRPLTHDLLRTSIQALGGNIDYVLINDLRRDVFYAKVVITHNGEQIEVDSRSSDAIALAVRAKCAIFVNEAVMERAGVVPEKDIAIDEDFDADPPQFTIDDDDVDALEAPPSERADSAEVDESKLSAFTDFLDTLNLDDLDDDEKN